MCVAEGGGGGGGGIQTRAIVQFVLVNDVKSSGVCEPWISDGTVNVLCVCVCMRVYVCV